jgi:hypothetical protein
MQPAAAVLLAACKCGSSSSSSFAIKAVSILCFQPIPLMFLC